MSKPTKAELAKYKTVLKQQLATLRGDVGSMKDEALRASDQDASVDHLADQGTDNYDQGFMLGLIENEEETIAMIEEALERIDGRGEWDFGVCPVCAEELENQKKAKDVKKGAKATAAKLDPWIPKARLEYLPWARYCIRHQEAEERNRESA
jgi:RNA polymerase-binding transcription factor DksA